VGIHPRSALVANRRLRRVDYINKGLTWQAVEQATDTDPPEVPDDYNPVGVYRRSFDVAADWDGRRTFLHFEGSSRPFSCGSKAGSGPITCCCEPV
jgi:hypothetical protein